MIIMTEKRIREELEKEKQRAYDDAWKMERENRLMERICDLERRVDKLEGKEPEELTPVNSPL